MRVFQTVHQYVCKEIQVNMYCMHTHNYHYVSFDVNETDHVKQRLDDYALTARFSGKLKVVRNNKREGLIRTRINGAKVATGDVLLWLDAHCEVGINWLAPLLTPIALNR